MPAQTIRIGLRQNTFLDGLIDLAAPLVDGGGASYTNSLSGSGGAGGGYGGGGGGGAAGTNSVVNAGSGGAGAGGFAIITTYCAP